jgi:hypothetical protein
LAFNIRQRRFHDNDVRFIVADLLQGFGAVPGRDYFKVSVGEVYLENVCYFRVGVDYQDSTRLLSWRTPHNHQDSFSAQISWWKQSTFNIIIQAS